MTGPLWLGIDLGTQSVKVSIVDDDGLVRGEASAALVSVRSGPRHDQDPKGWSAAARTATADAVSRLGASEHNSIAGIAICATSGTITTVDSSGVPVSSGIMYDDARAGDLAREASDADHDRWKRLGYRIQPTWALPKIMWLVRAGLLPTGIRVAHQADVVASAITGQPVASDWSHALKSGYDLIEEEWPPSLAKLGIDERMLPAVVAPGTELGRASTEWARVTGVPVGTPVFAGMTDGCAAGIGAGALALGDWHSVIGTTLVVKAVSDRIVVDDTGAVYSHRAPHDGLWFPGGASNVGAGVLTALFDTDLLALTARAASRFDDQLGSIPLSYPLPGTGERFPLTRPDAIGFVMSSGVRAPLASDDRESLFASILLGIAMVERLCVDTMTASGVPVDGAFSSSGGGSRNRWWTGLRADLLGRSISIPRSAEGSIGMAILAAWSATPHAPLPSVAARMSPTGSIIEPDLGRHDVLTERYRRFLELIDDWIQS